ncbi:GTP-binding protein 2-like [Centruroides sculpturatus]|uniref:GTP-binding protein 2-like n=1 Tax=Centruroides sculpturatus TaxID=218467 RepID=UPI000C6DAE47|nr:GTP-binding protein 2-like [Centruroides sculpturatus]XP_023227813.1 GTP-binding protein 2-like [Centruroides sculpturatus]
MESFVGLFDPETQDEGVASSLSPLPVCLPPEAAEGNIEYKLKLVNPSKSRFEHLVTQMKWRLREGQGEAIYEIGVEDGGMLVGLTSKEMAASLHTLYLMAEKLGATLTVLRERTVSVNLNEEPRKAAEVLVRKVPDDQQTIELRVAVLGNMDVGKSTLLGVLTQGEPDNGHGSARLNLFRHLHEIQSGRTSSISREILGFNSHGSPVTYGLCRTAEEICETSSKLITFIDLAGHHKYLRTTVFGLTGHSPHFAMLVVSAVCGVVGTTREHLGLAMALEVPIVVVVNKIDLASPAALQSTLNQLHRVLKGPGCKKVPLQVSSEDDAITAASILVSESIAPIFTVSCVTGDNLELLYTFLNVLPPSISHKERERLMQLPSEFQIDETFRVPEVGIVVGGLLTKGMIREGDQYLVGPADDGSFYPVRVSSLHRHKVPCRVVRACESATLALSNPETITLRRGMVLTTKDSLPPICVYFQARIHVLFHSTMIYSGFQATVHIGNVRQTATVIAIMGKQGIATNETASVMFKFMKQPECVHPGSRLLFREGHTKGIGRVTQVFAFDDGKPLREERVS